MKEPILVKVIAPSAKIAFDKAKREAIKMYGKNPFSGTIATCTMGNCQMEFDRYLKYNDSKAMHLIKELGYGDDNVAHFINMGRVHYRIIHVKRDVHQYDAVYRQRYIVTDLDGKVLEPAADHTFEFKGQADEKALSYVLLGEEVMVRKAMVILSGGDVVTTFSNVATKETQPTEPAFRKTEVDNYFPEYEFWFFANVIK